MKTSYSPTGQSWGLLASLDLFGCTPAKINNGKAIEKYVVDLCDLINMKRYGKCHLELFGAKGTPLAGYSMFQFIETSCISGHFSESDNSAYIDVFSCSEFDPEAVKKYSVKYFGAKGCKMNVVARMYDESVRPAKPVAKKAAAKPAVAKKPVAKKAVAKAAVARKVVAKKAVARPAVAKKVVAAKPAVARKVVAKKPVAKKAIAKKPRA